VARPVGHSNFKNGFCQVDSDGCILHSGFLLSKFGDPNTVMTLAL
jgi:hypothetical protein